jgi:hypothetical protein
MELTDSALLEMQLGTGNVVALGQISDDLLADPASVEDLVLGLAEAPFHVWNAASVSGLAAEIVRVLDIDLVVCSS